MKKLFLLFAAVVMTVCAMAQDVIYRSTNDSIKAKVLTVNNSEVSYRLAGYEDGPIFTLKTEDIVAIHYANGMYQYFANTPEEQENNPRPKSTQSTPTKAHVHEIGIIGGGINGLSYKRWFSETTALQLDVAVGLTAAVGALYYEGNNLGGGTNPQYDFTVNPNIERHFNITPNCKFYIGGGVNFGLLSDLNNVNPDYILGKFGANGVLGVAIHVSSIAIALDFRPGYGLGFYNEQTAHFSFFDWKCGLALRYAI